MVYIIVIGTMRGVQRKSQWPKLAGIGVGTSDGAKKLGFHLIPTARRGLLRWWLELGLRRVSGAGRSELGGPVTP